MTYYSTSVFGALRQNYIKATLGLLILPGPPAACEILLFVKISPSIISVSSIVPLTLFEILMSLKSTLSVIDGSTILRTASTAIGAKMSEFPLTTLLDKEVLTQLIKESLSVSSTGIVIV